jgi:hypothetical protein
MALVYTIQIYLVLDERKWDVPGAWHHWPSSRNHRLHTYNHVHCCTIEFQFKGVQNFVKRSQLIKHKVFFSIRMQHYELHPENREIFRLLHTIKMATLKKTIRASPLTLIDKAGRAIGEGAHAGSYRAYHRHCMSRSVEGLSISLSLSRFRFLACDQKCNYFGAQHSEHIVHVGKIFVITAYKYPLLQAMNTIWNLATTSLPRQLDQCGWWREWTANEMGLYKKADCRISSGLRPDREISIPDIGR